MKQKAILNLFYTIIKKKHPRLQINLKSPTTTTNLKLIRKLIISNSN